jgi:hypothetical protein
MGGAGGNNAAPASSAAATSAVAPTTSRAAAAAPTTSRAAAAASSAAAVAPAPNGVSPVGLAMNYESKANIASFGANKVGWYYSWNLDTLPNTAGLEFVPMIWGADAARRFDGKLREGTTHVLGFNERELGRVIRQVRRDADRLVVSTGVQR